jgi:Cu(I)/Ag(I) efflux system protein CusF
MTMQTILSAALLASALPVLAASHLTDAEVRKIDKDSAKITLKHGEIKNLDMPAMTMVFTVQDKALLDKVKKDDKVRFAAKHEGGKYVVTEIEVAK